MVAYALGKIIEKIFEKRLTYQSARCIMYLQGKERATKMQDLSLEEAKNSLKKVLTTLKSCDIIQLQGKER